MVGQQSSVAMGVTLTRGTTRGSSASQTSCAAPQIPVTCDSSRTGPTGNITQTANKGGDTPPICSSTLRNPKVFYPKQNWNNGRHDGGFWNNPQQLGLAITMVNVSPMNPQRQRFIVGLPSRFASGSWTQRGSTSTNSTFSRFTMLYGSF